MQSRVPPHGLALAFETCLSSQSSHLLFVVKSLFSPLSLPNSVSLVVSSSDYPLNIDDPDSVNALLYVDTPPVTSEPLADM